MNFDPVSQSKDSCVKLCHVCSAVIEFLFALNIRGRKDVIEMSYRDNFLFLVRFGWSSTVKPVFYLNSRGRRED